MASIGAGMGNSAADVALRLAVERQNQEEKEREKKQKLEEKEEEEEKRWWCNGKLIALVTVVVGTIIVWSVIKPTKPRFVLLDATVFALNVTGTNLVTSRFQVTVRTSNPNNHISIFYDRLVAYASFYDQQITLPTSIPTVYQETNGVSIWSPLVSGVSVPVATFTSETLKQDQTTWIMPILFEFDGWVNWKVRPFPNMSYHIHVNCQAFIPVGNPAAGIPFNNEVVKYQLYQGCTVNE